jgi:hypothetical protein
MGEYFMSVMSIKKKETIKVSINGSAVPQYINNIAYSLNEIAAAGNNKQKRALRNNKSEIR